MDEKIVHQIKTNPSQIISAFDMVYTTSEHLQISRKKTKTSFDYYRDSKKIRNERDVSKYNALKIPPAWAEVKISIVDNSHILAIGYDGKNRKQYSYHPKWSALKNQTKFYKMLGFAEALPKLRQRVIKDLNQAKFTKSKVLAIVMRLLEESHIRVGNSYYEKRNKTYGLATLRTRHLDVFNTKFKLEFIGKRGKKHKVTIRNKKLLELINKCEEIPGWELFQYFDEHGNKHAIDSTMVNQYIHETCGDIYSAKDFRTWAASLITFEALKRFEANDTKQKKTHILKAIDTAAEALNHTRAVCRNYYVHPQIIKCYEDHTIRQFFEMTDRLPKTSETQLQPNEMALKSLISTYQPQLKQSDTHAA